MALAAMLACSVVAAQNLDSVLGRYVRVEHRSNQPATIELAEMQVFSGGVNVASMGEASGSGTWGASGVDFGAELAIDEVENGNVYYNHSTALTSQPPVVNAYWELAFPKPAKIDKLTLYIPSRRSVRCPQRRCLDLGPQFGPQSHLGTASTVSAARSGLSR
jgi:hypothetical protein